MKEDLHNTDTNANVNYEKLDANKLDKIKIGRLEDAEKLKEGQMALAFEPHSNEFRLYIGFRYKGSNKVGYITLGTS